VKLPDYYRRQMRLPEVGISGQRRLANARVVVVGLGALGCPAATYLVRAGVGSLVLVDGDRVDESNLHRQPLYVPADRGRQKADAAARALAAMNPHVHLEPHARFFAGGPAAGAPNTSRTREGEPIASADLVLDCTDRFSSRFAVHDACQRQRTPLVSAAVTGFTGQVQFFPFNTDAGPCLRCLYPQTPEDGCTGSCAEDGILGAAAGAMGSLQALTGLRVLLGAGGVEAGVTYTMDLATLRVHRMGWDRRPDCPDCGTATADREQAGAPEYDEGGIAGAQASRPRASSSSAASASPENTFVLDVREAHEVKPDDRIAFPGARLMPMHMFYREVEDLDPEASYVLICEHGVRSAAAMRDMRELGFRNVRHIAGGYARLREAVCSE
jgi:adenylyltransferase/sulfurtransferase